MKSFLILFSKLNSANYIAMMKDNNSVQTFRQAVIDNMIACFSEMAKSAKNPDTGITHCPNGLLINSDSHYAILNGLFSQNWPIDNFPKQLEDLIENFSKSRLPFSWWWLHEEEISNNLKEILKEYGFKPAGQYTGIAKTLDDLPSHLNPPSRIEIKQVRSKEDYSLFIDILSETFQLSAKIKEEFKYFLNNYNEQNSPFRHYIGYYDNQALSTGSSFFQAHIVGLYCEPTDPVHARS